jgi:hypothetical protein
MILGSYGEDHLTDLANTDIYVLIKNSGNPQ